MSGSREGGLKAKQKILAMDKDFYKRIGRLGGSAETSEPKGFACNPASSVNQAKPSAIGYSSPTIHSSPYQKTTGYC